jgi:hypothetical protein
MCPRPEEAPACRLLRGTLPPLHPYPDRNLLTTGEAQAVLAEERCSDLPVKNVAVECRSGGQFAALFADDETAALHTRRQMQFDPFQLLDFDQIGNGLHQSFRVMTRPQQHAALDDSTRPQCGFRLQCSGGGRLCRLHVVHFEVAAPDAIDASR